MVRYGRIFRLKIHFIKRKVVSFNAIEYFIITA